MASRSLPWRYRSPALMRRPPHCPRPGGLLPLDAALADVHAALLGAVAVGGLGEVEVDRLQRVVAGGAAAGPHAGDVAGLELVVGELLGVLVPGGLHQRHLDRAQLLAVDRVGEDVGRRRVHALDDVEVLHGGRAGGGLLPGLDVVADAPLVGQDVDPAVLQLRRPRDAVDLDDAPKRHGSLLFELGSAAAPRGGQPSRWWTRISEGFLTGRGYFLPGGIFATSRIEMVTPS